MFDDEFGCCIVSELLSRNIDSCKAVEHGYRVFIFPNPIGFRTVDFVFLLGLADEKWAEVLCRLFC